MIRMPRNACRRHPKKDIVEIPKGTRYCKRCHHLIPPEAESPPSFEIVKELAEASATPEVIGVLPIDTNPEAELPEESKAIVEVAEEALQVIIDDIVEVDNARDKPELEAEPEVSAKEAAELAKNMDIALKEQIKAQLAKEAKPEVIVRKTESQEETAPAEAVEPIAEEVAAPSPEEEAEAVKETLDILQDETYDDLLSPGTDKNAEIARLKAKLAKLEPKEE